MLRFKYKVGNFYAHADKRIFDKFYKITIQFLAMRMKFLFPIVLSISIQAMGSSDRLFYILILPFVQTHIVKFEPILLYFASDYSSLIRQTQYNKIDKNTLLFYLLQSENATMFKCYYNQITPLPQWSVNKLITLCTKLICQVYRFNQHFWNASIKRIRIFVIKHIDILKIIQTGAERHCLNSYILKLRWWVHVLRRTVVPSFFILSS